MALQAAHSPHSAKNGADAASGLTLDQLVEGSPAPTACLPPEQIMRVVIRDEIDRGRVIEQAPGSYALVADRFDAGVVTALRKLSTEP